MAKGWPTGNKKGVQIGLAGLLAWFGLGAERRRKKRIEKAIKKAEKESPQ